MICDSRGSPSGLKKAMGMKPFVEVPSGDPISLREYSDLFSYSVMEDPSGSNLVAFIENVSRVRDLNGPFELICRRHTYHVRANMTFCGSQRS